VGLNYQDYVSVDPSFYRPDESVQLVGSINKLQTQTGWSPQYSFNHLVEVMVKHDLKELKGTPRKK
jgi:GDPmannose 4,6-dehydratase